jgi:hypothetical protein
MNTLTSADNVLIADIRELIDRARQRAATAVNAERAQLNWRIGWRIMILHMLCAESSGSHLRRIAALEARREKTRALKQGMMQELLTGRIRLV